MFRWIARLFSSAREPARSTCAARLMAAATDHQRTPVAPHVPLGVGGVAPGFSGLDAALVELRQVRHDQLSQEIWG